MSDETPARSREEQIEALADDFFRVGSFTYAGDTEKARAHILEAERRGAAKAESHPVAWVPVHPKHGHLWTMTTCEPSAERLPHTYPLVPLYERPVLPVDDDGDPVDLEEMAKYANAMKERIAELEAEVKRLQTPEYFGFEGEEEGYDTVADALDCASIDDFDLVELLGFRQIGTVWAFYDGKRAHHFPTAEEAEAAIAALATPGAQSGEGV